MSPLRRRSALEIKWSASQGFSGSTGPCRHVAYTSRQRHPLRCHPRRRRRIRRSPTPAELRQGEAVTPDVALGAH